MSAPSHTHSGSLTHLSHKSVNSSNNSAFSPKPVLSHSITLSDDDSSLSSSPLMPPKPSPPTVSLPPSSSSSTSAPSLSLSSTSSTLPTSAVPVPTSFFRRRIILPLFEVLKSGATPEGIALSLAFGLTGGVFPVPTVTTLACIVLAWLFRLNFPAVQITNLLMTPVNLATFIPFIRGGEWLFGVESAELSLSLFQSDPLAAMGVFWKSLVMGMLAWLVFLPFGTAALYLTLRPIVQRLIVFVTTKRA